MKLTNILLSYMIKKVARSHGFLDPAKVMAQLSRFGQPSEIMVPTELLRSGALLHARGLINSQAIQHNLDWIWPYWVNRQFDPEDKSFVPRAFSATHINLTHRNWTAVGLPDKAHTPIADPRGLITPLWDSWSIDFWILDADKDGLYPSKIKTVKQELQWKKDLSVITHSQERGKHLISRAHVEADQQQTFCTIDLRAISQKNGWLIISLRPYNPEGISFINTIEQLTQNQGWLVNNKTSVLLSEPPQKYQMSEYLQGDVANTLFMPSSINKISCQVGMATAAALFDLKTNIPKEVTVRIPLKSKKNTQKGDQKTTVLIDDPWDKALAPTCQINIPDERFQNLFEIGLRTLVLHTADEVFAGPYTYKRFWFRDAVLITHALLYAGLKERASAVIEKFIKYQKPSGYFASQEGEWDSNGQVLWLLKHYVEITNENLPSRWKNVILKAGRWIIKKRSTDNNKTPHAGLLPSGFSAEHLGPSDYYYWDNFWSVAGLNAAAFLMQKFNEPDWAERFHTESASLTDSIDKSLAQVRERLGQEHIPASPYRRMDSGAIGSLAAGYPLQLWAGDDPRLLGTVEYLINNCLIKGGFFHDMSHSGINPYLTLHIAQVLLRNGDMRFYDLMDAIAQLASPTGQWPEAIHPSTKGGCMGDGQHVWAASEWILMMRNCFLREDRDNHVLILCPGVLPYWYAKQNHISFGPAPTAFGDVSLSITSHSGELIIEWNGHWHRESPLIEIHLPGFDPITVPMDSAPRYVIKPKNI